MIIACALTVYRGQLPPRRFGLAARVVAAAWFGQKRWGFGSGEVRVGVMASVRVFGSYRGDFVGCPRDEDVARVVCYRGIWRGGVVRPTTRVQFSR